MADEVLIETTSSQIVEVAVPGPQGPTGATGATGPQGPTIATENAPATNNILWEARTGAFTAVSGGRYVATGTFTVTNPATGNNGEMFQVVVASGTVTINGVAYAASRWPVTVARVSGAWTTLANSLTENLTLNGTNNVAPNQTAASGSSVMTRDLVDARTAEYLFCERGFYIIPPLQGSFTNAGSASGTLSTASGAFRMSTGTTAFSSSLYRANPGASIRFARTNNTAGIQWSRRVVLGWEGQIDVRSNGVLRLQFGRPNNATTIADLSGLGIGLIWDGSAGTITAEVHNGTTRNTGSCGTFTNTTAIWTSVRMVSSGGTLTVFINDTQAGTVSGAPTSDSGTIANNIHLSVENGAATTSYFLDVTSGFRVYVA